MKRLSMADALEEQWISGFIAGAVVVSLVVLLVCLGTALV